MTRQWLQIWIWFDYLFEFSIAFYGATLYGSSTGIIIIRRRSCLLCIDVIATFRKLLFPIAKCHPSRQLCVCVCVWGWGVIHIYLNLLLAKMPFLFMRTWAEKSFWPLCLSRENKKFKSSSILWTVIARFEFYALGLVSQLPFICWKLFVHSVRTTLGKIIYICTWFLCRIHSPAFERAHNIPKIPISCTYVLQPNPYKYIYASSTRAALAFACYLF